jgi:hypothetical protein
MQPGQETVENQHLDLESEADAQENQKFQPSPRHLELLAIFIAAMIPYAYKPRCSTPDCTPEAPYFGERGSR